MKSVLRRWTGILFCLFLQWIPAAAQPQTGSLSGTVLTSWEMPVPDATVTLTNRETGTKMSAITNLEGAYHLSGVAPGSYDLSASQKDFPPYRRLGIEIGGAAARKDIRFQPGKEDTAASVKELQAAVTANPDDSVARFQLGRAYFVAGNMESAAEQFVKAFKAHPDHLPTLVGLTQVALRTGDMTRALQFTQAMLKVNPETTLGAVLEALCLMRLGRSDDAREMLLGILKRDPDSVDALLELGALDISQKQYQEAETPLRRAYALDPSDLRGLEALAEIQIRLNQPDKAIQLVASELEKQPQSRELRRTLGSVQAQARQYDKAITTYRSILDQYRDAPLEQADLYARIGDVYIKTGDFAAAIENITKATQMAPANGSYLSSLGGLYDRTGKKQEAISNYRAALKLQPTNALLMNNLAYLMADTGGDLDEALSMAQQARRELPASNDILDTIGWIYLKKKLVDSSARVFADLVEKAPANPTFHYHYGLALAIKGDKSAAVQELNAALADKPSKAEESLIRELLRKLQ